jgi:predicted component of type VI protein secretion system
MKAASVTRSLSDFLTSYRPALVILSGEARGLEYRLDQPRTAVGRGPGVDLALDDASLRTRHALVEYASGGFVLRLADIEGEALSSLELKDGDRFHLGKLELQFTLEARD